MVADESRSLPQSDARFRHDTVHHLPAVKYIVVNFQSAGSPGFLDFIMHVARIIQQQFGRGHLKQKRRQPAQISVHW